MNTNSLMQFQTDVQGMANNMMVQAMCAEKGIDYMQLMQTAQQAHVQSILQQAEQKRIMQMVSEHYNPQAPAQGVFGKLKEAFTGSNNQPQVSIHNPFAFHAQPAQPMVSPFAQQIPAQTESTRVDKLEGEVSGIKNDVTEIKAMLGQLANAMQPQGGNIPLK